MTTERIERIKKMVKPAESPALSAISPHILRELTRIALQSLTASKHPLYSPGAEEILLMIMAHESRLGASLRQIGNGPGTGICQVEYRTMLDNYANFLDVPIRRPLVKQIGQTCGVLMPSLEHLTCNHMFNIIMARIWLYRRPGALPPATDIKGMAQYCSDHYNIAGAGTPEKYEKDYRDLVLNS